MRFELSVALRYLIPRWRQLSVSIISLISILVISLVVWLVVVFLSVTDGIEKKWVGELVTLNSPLRLTPKEAYYNSYYYQIDSVSSESNYENKSIGEKLSAFTSDPYDPSFDMELPPEFPEKVLDHSGALKDPVKESFALLANYPEIRAQEYEVTFGNLRLSVDQEEDERTFLTQVSYVASHDAGNQRLKELLVPLSDQDLTNLLKTISEGRSAWEEGPLVENQEHYLQTLFDHLDFQTVESIDRQQEVSPTHFLGRKELEGVAILQKGEVQKVILPQYVEDLPALAQALQEEGKAVRFIKVDLETPSAPLYLDENVSFEVNDHTLERFQLKGEIQGNALLFEAPFTHFAFKGARPLEKEDSLWIHSDGQALTLPSHSGLGEGVLIANSFQKSGVHIGDRGYLAYYVPSTQNMQEQRLPIYVAGFYDPGMMPVGSKLLFIDPKVTAEMRSSARVADSMLGNGVNLWVDDVSKAEGLKRKLQKAFKEEGLDTYFEIASFQDYEFAKPVLQQLKSDKTLFTLIAIIILIVACSNIISMLILLVNDKKKEIGILQALGASPKSIALIFGTCGFLTGCISSILGALAAIYTLMHLQTLVQFLSFLQGHEAFQAAFYGSQLPNELSLNALSVVLVATMIISLLAGLVPALKAARIRPSETLRSE